MGWRTGRQTDSGYDKSMDEHTGRQRSQAREM